jgi:hypothetical protein
MVTAGDFLPNPVTEKRVMEAIELYLTQKGFEIVDLSPTADFAVSFTVGARNKIDVHTDPAVIDGSWRWGKSYFGPTVIEDQYVEGVLSIDESDVQARTPVWHGYAEKRLTDADFANRSETVNMAVSEVLAEFPPQ